MRQVTFIPGDGIGPSIVDAARQVIDVTGVKIEWSEARAGEAACHELGTPLPDETLETIAKTGLALKGPCGTPVGKGFRSVNVAMRKEFDLYANLRPAIAFDGVPCRYPGLDIVTVRENTEGLYAQMEHWVGADNMAAMAIGVNTRDAMERICRFGFDYARSHGRKKVTVVHKANILKKFTGLFLEVAREIGKEYSDIELEDKIIDNMAMQMVIDPYQFDVIVTTNLFGDILSDLAAGLIGGLGMAPGANIGKKTAIFEAVHGTAPDIAGKNLANPSSVVLAGALMLDHMGEAKAATAVRDALKGVLKEGEKVTRDLNPQSGVSTTEMTEAIIASLETTCCH